MFTGCKMFGMGLFWGETLCKYNETSYIYMLWVDLLKIESRYQSNLDLEDLFDHSEHERTVEFSMSAKRRSKRINAATRILTEKKKNTKKD